MNDYLFKIKISKSIPQEFRDHYIENEESKALLQFLKESVKNSDFPLLIKGIDKKVNEFETHIEIEEIILFGKVTVESAIFPNDMPIPYFSFPKKNFFSRLKYLFTNKI